jgi:hypothetical protein
MRQLFALCAFTVIAFATGAAQTSSTYSQTEAERYIKSSESAWAESVATNDASVVERILAEDCVWVLDGRITAKSQAIAEAKSGPRKLSIQPSRIRPCPILRRHRSCSGKRNLDTQRRSQRPFCLDRHMASKTREVANRSCRRRLCADQELGSRLRFPTGRNPRFQNRECFGSSGRQLGD